MARRLCRGVPRNLQELRVGKMLAMCWNYFDRGEDRRNKDGRISLRRMNC